MKVDGYVVYNLATGAERWSGRGDAALQDLKPGLAALAIPLDAIGDEQVDLAAVKEHYCREIDATAGTIRGMFITLAFGQDMTYIFKAMEARAWVADNNSPTLMLNGEAAGRGLTIAALVPEVLARADAWAVIGGKIEGVRLRAKEIINATTTVGEMAQAIQVSWDSVAAP